MIDARPIIAMLCEKFPKAFVMYEQRRRPLKLGIHRDVAAALPALSVMEIKTAMRCYCGNLGYNRACVEGAARIDFDGNAVGTITADEAANAKHQVACIKAVWNRRTMQKKAAAKEALAPAEKAKAEALAAARAAEIEAAKPKPMGINAVKPTLTLRR
jgi:ProP effector